MAKGAKKEEQKRERVEYPTEGIEYPVTLSMPKGFSMKPSLKNYAVAWDIYKPRNFYEALWAISGSPLYMLWKLPKDTHRDLNNILNRATVISTKLNPEVGVAIGLTDGISHLMYGLKSSKKGDEESGRHVMSGLAKIAEGVGKTDLPEKSELLKEIDSVMKEHLKKAA